MNIVFFEIAPNCDKKILPVTVICCIMRISTFLGGDPIKKFLSGFAAGAIVFGTVGALAASYVAVPAEFKVFVNGKEFTSDPPALVVEDRTYLPLRAVGDALGVPVNWNAELGQAEDGTTTAQTDTTTYSRSNPAPVNVVQQYTQNISYATDNHTIGIRIMETIRGDKAWEMIKAANMFNDEPQEGYEYVLIKAAVSVLSVQNDNAFNVSEYKFAAFSSNNEEMPTRSTVAPKPRLQGKLYAGGNTEGWFSVLVKKDDPSPKLAYGLDYKGSGGIWFALS